MEIITLILSAFITSTISAVLGIIAIIIPEEYMVIALHGIFQFISVESANQIK
jgi:hypothetical protein